MKITSTMMTRHGRPATLLMVMLAMAMPGLLLAQPTLNLGFSSPATNAFPGAPFTGNITFSPSNTIFDATVTSGTSIVPQPNVSLSVGLTSVAVTLDPLTNTSGAVTVDVRGIGNGGTNTISFTVQFRPYPPTIHPIGDRSMPEDGVTNIPFIVTDPDTAQSSLTITAGSSNTNLVGPAEINLTGTTSNRFIEITPRPDINGVSTITVVAVDGLYTNSRNFTLTVTPVADPSVVTGIDNRSFGDNVGITNVFSGVSITDVDHDMPSNEILVATASLANDQIATFTNGQITIVRTGTPSQVTAAMAGLGVLPLPYRGLPGTINQVGASVRVRGASDNITVTNSISLSIEVINTPPTFGYTINPTSLVEGATVQPFDLTFISDPDTGDEEYTLLIELVNTNQANLITLFPTNQLEDNIAGLESGLAAIQIQASSGIMTSTFVNIPIRISLMDGYGGMSSETNNIRLVQAQNTPQITGIPVSTINKTDADPAFVIFPLAFVQDPDQGGEQLVRAVITQSNPLLGNFTATNLPFMTPLQLSTALQAVAFAPVAGVLPVGQFADTTVTLTVIDSSGLSSQNSGVKIRITSVNNAPQILNVPPANQQPVLIPPSTNVRPFAALGLTSDDTNTILFTVSIDNINKGSLTNLGAFTQTGPGVFQMTGFASNILSSLTNMRYVVNGAYLFPPDDPGGTVFTLSGRDYALLTQTKTLYIQIQESPRHHLVVRAQNDGLPGSLNYVLANAGNNDVISFALPSYPAIIRLSGAGPSTLIRNLTIKGPGANLLTISGDQNGDLTPDRQLFRIRSRVVMEGLTFAHGTAVFGGAFLVESNGFLTLRQCAVVDSTAAQYGGAIDVDGGQLTLDGCYIARNSVSADNGQSGAGVSVYSDKEVQIVNTLFANNAQLSESGDGGGALVVQNRTVGTPLNAYVTHCTFVGNTDASDTASAALSVDFGSRIRTWNSIYRDFSGRNLEVAGTGEVISHGGNLCDDSSRTLNLQQGQSGDVFLLNHVTDETEIDALLAPIVDQGDPLPYASPLPGSPAIEKGAGSTLLADGRGILRQGVADSGASEYSAAGRLVINEIHVDASSVNFVEIQVRRDSTPIDLTPYALYVDGVKVHDFVNGAVVGTNSLFSFGAPVSPLIQPGFGMVIAFTNQPIAMTSSANPTPVVRPSLTNAALDLPNRGVISIGKNGSTPLVSQSYLNAYVDPVSGTNLLNTTGNSMTLAPQYRGFALLPHSWVLPGPFDGANTTLGLALNPLSPGAGSDGTPFGQDNAEPLAVVDLFTVNEDDFSLLTVLDNDFDGDGTDRLVIVDVSTLSAPATGDAATASSVLLAGLAIEPGAAPLRGTDISYDPRAAAALQALPVGVEILDSFHYEIIDIGSAVIEGYVDAGGGTTLVASTNHRLTNGTPIVISGADPVAFNGAYAVTVVNEDQFAIALAYPGDAAIPGIWETVWPREPSSRSEASVSVRVIGENDPPIAQLDVITGVTERTTARLMVRPELAGSVLSFPEDPVPTPVMLSQNIQANDDDIDTDDDWSSLRVVGVLGGVNAISGYAGVAGQQPVTVTSLQHGLSNGDTVLIANYGGHASYNGYHVVTVVDADTFTIPKFFVDDAPEKGVWVVLDDGNRYAATTDVGADVTLTLRANATEDHLIYDASVSDFLQGLAEGETYTNRFYYAVEDSHGGIGIGAIDMIVEGVNNTPVALPDADSLDILDPLVGTNGSLSQVLATGLDLMYTLDASSGSTGRVDLHVLDEQDILPGTLVLADFFTTDEDTVLDIDQAELLANDSDIDRTDVLQVIAVDAVSEEGAAVSLLAGIVTYNPSVSSNLQALAREEMIIDRFEVTVSDSFMGGTVTSLVAVLVVGVNDSPVANPVFLTTHEDEVFVFDPRTNDTDRDINLLEPDNRIGVIPVTNWPNPGQAQVDMSTTNVRHDATVSELLNQLADWQSFSNVFGYSITDNSFLFADDDEFYVPAGSVGIALDALANDRDYTDAEGGLVIVDAGPTWQGGTVSIASNGQYLVYSSPVAFTGDDYFRYTIQNSRGDVDSGRVMVRSTVAAINGVLRANDDRFTVAAGETANLNVLANDNMLPLGGGALTITALISTTQPGQPVLTNNTFVYTATNGLAPLVFEYEVAGGGPARARAMAQANVIERRGTLNTRNDAVSVLPGSLANEFDVLANDTLVNESTAHLRIAAILTSSMYGTVTTNAAGTRLVYTPNAGFVGLDQVIYLATDKLGGTGTGVVSIAVGMLDVASDFYKVAATTNPVPVGLNVLVNDRTIPVSPTSLRVVSVEPASTNIGSIQPNISGTQLLFTPSNVQGQVEFRYVVEDGGTPARTTTGRVTIATVPSGIYANPDRYIVRGGGSSYVLNVLTNDISYPNVNKTYSIVSLGAGPNAPNNGGSVSIDGNVLVYTPAPGFYGEETFTYTMSDSVVTDVAQVSVSVRRGDIFANDDAYAVYFEIPAGTNVATSFVLPVLYQDAILPPMNQVLSISSIGVGPNAPDQGGVVQIAGDNQSLIYRPVLVTSTSYVETFTYEVTDGTDRRGQGVVRVRVRNRANALVAITQNDAYAVARNSSNNVLSVLANDAALPGTAAGWSITAVTPAVNGGHVAISNTTVRYTPPAGFVGLDSFTYSVNDGLGGSGTASVTIRVGAMPTLPDIFTVLSGSVSNELDVLANDALVPAYVEEYILQAVDSADAGGSVSLSAQNTVLYTPSAAHTGAYPYVEHFRYLVADDTAGVVTGFVRVVVQDATEDNDSSTIHLLVEGRNDQPWIENPAVLISITDKESTKPFTSVQFIEVDEQTMERVDVGIALDVAAKGSLRNLGEFDQVGPGQYAMTNITAAYATLVIRDLVFDPTENRIPVPGSENTLFTLTITDNKSPVVEDTNSVVNVTAVNDAPSIGGTQAGQVMQQGLPIKLFAGVTIDEADDLTMQPLSVTVRILQPGQGALASIGSFIDLGGGVYAATGLTATAASSQLRLMEFVLTSNGLGGAGMLLTQFAIEVQDGFAPTVSDQVTSVVAMPGLEQTLQPVALDTNLIEGVGWSVAMTSNRVVAGAQYAEANSTNLLNFGHVFVYERATSGTNAWIQTAAIPAVNILAESYFGSAVDVDGNTIVVAANRDIAPSSNRSGRVYVYDLNPTSLVWQLTASLHAPVTNGVGRFGSAISLQGDTLAVGASEIFQGGITSGAVFVYGRHAGGTNAWGLQRSILPSGLSQNARFGASVALDGDTLMIGAPRLNTIPTNSGAVFVHERDAGGSNLWTLVQRLTSQVASANARFGTSVDVQGGQVVIGAPLEENGAGAAYLFDRIPGTNLWSQTRRLTAPVRETNDVFGTAVSISGDVMLVGAPRLRDVITSNSTALGSVVMYARAGSTGEWLYASTIRPVSNSVFALFGQSLDHVNRSAAIGAPIDLTRNLSDVFGDAGVVYMYDFDFNRAPVVATPVADQYALVNEPFNFVLPDPVFVEPDFNDSFVMAVSFPGGGALGYDALTGTVTGTPTQAGIIPVRLVATDEGGLSSTNEFQVIVLDAAALPPSARTLWLVDNFGPGAATSAVHAAFWNSNSDGDGQDQDQEYAFGGDPNNADDLGIGLRVPVSAGLGRVSFIRRTDDPDLTYRLEATMNIRNGPWVQIPGDVVSEVVQDVGPGLEQVDLSVVLDPAAPWKMYRIRVTY